jgi:hypothetical protein
MIGMVTEVHKGSVAVDVIMWSMTIYIIMKRVIIWGM